ncbi:UNVERIFIED_CONTAM: putative serine/threonine-protein kinase PBL3 [Sesamum angustifolium]|uniref:Serine/threonine-protein kinase PBL3 n=1 Tax=Sesamum angustifolium TaxID=2727405 RepID=A0AAW2QSV7_9LAMI
MGICLGSPAKSDDDGSASGQVFGIKVAPGNAKPGFNPSNTQMHSGILSDALVGSIGDLSVSSNLKSFTFDDLKSATKNFSPDSLIGEGGFGYVFKGWINENTLAPCKPGTRMVVAVKKLKAQSFQGHREWLNLSLCPYLWFFAFLVSIAEVHCYSGVQPMAWATRMQIALDIARGLSFLHSLNANIIYRDLKASNVLIDSKFHAKLSDFGLARKGPSGDGSHVSTRVVGTIGYAAPEYVASGRLTSKSDVYSFGVVLLELLSGKRASGDESICGAEGKLVDWAKPFLGDNRHFSRIMDTRLRGEYSKRAAQTVASLAFRCLSVDPKNRPPMPDVQAELEQIQALGNSPRAKMEPRVKTPSSHRSHSTAQ